MVKMVKVFMFTLAISACLFLQACETTGGAAGKC